MAKDPFVCKITVLGDRDVGKTTLVSQFIWKRFEEGGDPTVEDSYTTSMVVNEQEYQLEILDTSGAKVYSLLIDSWIRANEAFVLVYSISSKSSFLRVWEIFIQIQEIKKSPVPMILVGNKVEMTKRVVSLLEGEALARKLGCEFVETSAKNGLNVDESFYKVVKQWQRQRPTGMRVLDSLIGSLHKWNNLVKLVESDIPESAIANTSSLVPSPPLKQNVVVRLVRKVAILRRKTSSPGIPDNPLLAGSYDGHVQTALKDIATFLDQLGNKLRALEEEESRAKLQAAVKAALDVGENRIVREARVESRNNKDIFQQIYLSILECIRLCNDASYDVVRRGECGSTIQEMKKEFSGMMERAKLHFSGDTS